VLNEVLYADAIACVLLATLSLSIFVFIIAVKTCCQLFGFHMSPLTWLDVGRGSGENVLVGRFGAIILSVVLFAHFNH
jgi:hypothetical protein